MLQKFKIAFPSFRGHSALGWAYAILLLALNLYISFDLFTVEYTRSLNSIEGNFIALSRFMMEHPSERMWWPLWDAGMPFQHSYFPLLPSVVALLGKTTGYSAAASYHIVTAVFYCLGPVTLFLMTWGISRLPGPSLVSGAAFSLLSPSAMLVPEIALDLGGLWNPQRLRVLVYYGGAPQIAALTLLPLAILFLYWSFEYRKRWLYVLTGVLMAAVVLTNAFGAMAMAMAVVCLLSVQESGFQRKLLLTLSVGVLSYLWISPWLPPSLLATIASNSSTAGGDFRWSEGTLLGAVIIAVVLLSAWALAMRWIQREYMRFFLLFGVLVTSIPLVAYGGGFNVLPQPHRYHLEMEMALCLLLGFVLWPAMGGLRPSARVTAVALLALLAVQQTIQYRRYARDLVQPIDITETVEYQTANWMRNDFPSRRVMVSGSCSFWFNVFTDTPQFGGGHDTLTPNPVQKIALFTIYTGQNAGEREGEIAVLWLKAFGTHAVQVTGPQSKEHYKPFRNPEKFEGLLPVLRKGEGNTIYRVPQRSESLVYVVPASAVVDRQPIHGLDVAKLQQYVAALEDASLPVPEVTWRNFHSALIRADLQPDQVLSAQMNYHPGWRATHDGVDQATFRDGLGLLAIEPDCRGPCEIELVYGGGFEAQATRLLSFSAMAAIAAVYGVLFFKERRLRR